MTKQQAQKGFTLVELAIVLTIIGLLLGGILKGRQLMQNARITSTIAQVNAIEAASTTFLDTQGGLPGDLSTGATRIPNCGNCTPLAANADDGRIGRTAWDLIVAQSATAVATGPASVDNETLLYWAMLSQSGLLGGISYDGSQLGANAARAGTHTPSARIGGGFTVGYANGTTATPNAVPTITRMSGTVLFLSPSPTVASSTVTGTEVMDPATAAQIDRKADDGLAATGRAQASGFNTAGATGCFRYAAGPPMVHSYNETVTARDCNMFFQING